MSMESRCPTCGSPLSEPGQKCPFCAEAQKLLQHLATEEQVRLCARCGAVLQGDEEEICHNCLLAKKPPSPIPWRRDDRIAGWIRDKFVESAAEGTGIMPCPSCQQSVPLSAAFCPHCGQKLKGAIPDRESTAETAAPLMPLEETAAPPAVMAAQTAAEASPGRPEQPVLAEKLVEEEAVSAPPPQPSTLQQARDFVQEQFQPTRPEEVQGLSFWQRVRQFFRSLRRPDRSSATAQTIVWILLGLVVLALVAVVLLWGLMLRSGGITVIR